ncbi:MAG: thermonuclease family protein [Clostridiales Family XIII bacterium]|jgi:DNA modification methylase|nr:thermonuclease family protein [Clostridiales Family XIII bacterium]
MDTIHRIINGDSRQMSLISSKSIHLVITSPPYWQLKDYGDENQIGFHQSYEEYINNLNLVWKECDRVLHDGCRLCINIGDQFARSVYYGRYKVIPIRTEIIRFCETLGMDYMGAVIWQKNTTMNTTGGGSVMGSFPYPRNGILKIDYEFILIFKKQGKPPTVGMDTKIASEMSKDEWNTFFSSHWTFGGARQDKHMAVFPEELPHRLIKMFSFAGEMILDPFLGSGTTALAARNLNRNTIGYEINPEYIKFCEEKLNVPQHDFFGAIYSFEKDEARVDTKILQDSLPYKFFDPHKMDKKIDVKKLQFGSKIDQSSGEREKYYTVKKIINPQFVELNNNLIVRLIGIKEKPSVNGAATSYLAKKLLGQKVYMKYDDEKYDMENNLQCYLYLKNKTFINAHLLKEGLAVVDEQAVFRQKNKFVQLEAYYG